MNKYRVEIVIEVVSYETRIIEVEAENEEAVRNQNWQPDVEIESIDRIISEEERAAREEEKAAKVEEEAEMMVAIQEQNRLLDLSGGDYWNFEAVDEFFEVFEAVDEFFEGHDDD